MITAEAEDTACNASLLHARCMGATCDVLGWDCCVNLVRCANHSEDIMSSLYDVLESGPGNDKHYLAVALGLAAGSPPLWQVWEEDVLRVLQQLCKAQVRQLHILFRLILSIHEPAMSHGSHHSMLISRFYGLLHRWQALCLLVLVHKVPLPKAVT